ncbi:MAG: hypothetical protein KBS81_00735, partial [Spirochaetales bacterium]|nr:hypothetical protein [Candidatus Physcosoma equi]
SGTGATLGGEEVYLLYGAESQVTYLTLFDKNYEEKGSVELGYGALAGDFAFLSDGVVLFVLSSSGTERLALLDLETMEVKASTNTLGLDFSSLSADGVGNGFFGYVEKEDPSSLSRYGEVRWEENHLFLRLSPKNFLGGVYYPVKKENGLVYYISRLFDGQRVSRATIDRLDLGPTYLENLEPWEGKERRTEEETTLFLSSSLEYKALSYMKKGVLFPFAESNFGLTKNAAGLGVTYMTEDPTETHLLVLTMGVDKFLNPIYGFDYSIKDALSFHAYRAYADNEDTPEKEYAMRTELDAQLSLGYEIGPRMGSVQAVETLSFVQMEGMEGKWKNDLTLSYSNLFRVDNGRYNLFGFGSSVSYQDTLDHKENGVWNLVGTLYLPKLLPLRSTEKDTFNLPLVFSYGVKLKQGETPLQYWNGKVYFYSHETQKYTPLLGLFIRNVNVYGRMSGSLQNDTVKGESYSLCATTIFTPILGELGSIYALELGGVLTWKPETESLTLG